VSWDYWVRVETDVRVMERRPPPAPARAWAMLSPCWALGVATTVPRGCSTGLDMLENWQSTEELGLRERKLSTMKWVECGEPLGRITEAQRRVGLVSCEVLALDSPLSGLAIVVFIGSV